MIRINYVYFNRGMVGSGLNEDVWKRNFEAMQRSFEMAKLSPSKLLVSLNKPNELIIVKILMISQHDLTVCALGIFPYRIASPHRIFTIQLIMSH